MKVVVLSRPGTDYSRTVDDFVRDLEREHQTRVDQLSLDTRDGSSTASLYDIMEYPAVLVVREDGQLVKEWHGRNMPLKSEVTMYTHM